MLVQGSLLQCVAENTITRWQHAWSEPLATVRLTYITQVLDEQQEVLLFKGCMDLDTMKATSWPLHYVARPACNGCSMLVRRYVFCSTCILGSYTCILLATSASQLMQAD